MDAYAQVSNAQRMLDFYRWSNNFRLHERRTHKCDPALNTDFIASKLEQLAEANEAEGKRGFAFVIYDKKAHRLIVARDSTRNPMPLYWGLAQYKKRMEKKAIVCSCDPALNTDFIASTEEKNELFSRLIVFPVLGVSAWRKRRLFVRFDGEKSELFSKCLTCRVRFPKGRCSSRKGQLGGFPGRKASRVDRQSLERLP